MYKTPAQARRMIRALDLPKDLPKVQEKRIYRCENFIDLFIDKCDALAFQDFQTGLEMAETALRLVEETADSSADLTVRALIFLAGAYRQLRNFKTAEQLFQRALSIPVGKQRRAYLYCRISNLRTDQKHFSEAFDLLEKALAIYEEAREESQYGMAVFYRGYTHLESGNLEKAFDDFSLSLCFINPKEQAVVHYCAIHNLAYIVGLTAISPADLDLALKHLAKARRMIKSGIKSIPRLKLKWLEGVILTKFASGNLVERVFKSARRGFVKAGAIADAACVSLDLGVLYRDQRRWEELEALAGETYELLQGQLADVEALGALRLWVDAVYARTFDTEVIEQVRGLLQKKKIG